MLGAMEMITSLTMTRIANGNKKDLGFIGMLTSSLTNFFDTSTDNDLEKELAELNQHQSRTLLLARAPILLYVRYPCAKVKECGSFTLKEKVWFRRK